jgi:hypothetical protein
MTTEALRKNGKAAASLLAGGIGALMLGLMTTLSEALPALGNTLSWYNPAGPLSGKTTLAVSVWLASWVILDKQWKEKELNFERIAAVSLILLLVGILFTFPPFFELFVSE